ncbi:MAG: VOC family protein [Acidimicrobiia bacterium]|nr:VOC family protein [Acidimicrobiia bacterium]
MAVLGISHVAVGVSDMERALVFYRDIIGLRVTLDIEEKAFGSADPDAYRRRAVYLRTEDGPHEFFVVLDQQLGKEPFGTPPRILQLGTHHFSFWVDDLEAIFERMVQAGFRVIMGPTAADAEAYGEPAGSGRVLTALIKDQDGNPVQLDQRLAA